MSVEGAALDELFNECDADQSGFIEETELSAICPDLNEDLVHEIFTRLDKDGDGKISNAEFSDGFKVRMLLGVLLGVSHSLYYVLKLFDLDMQFIKRHITELWEDLDFRHLLVNTHAK